MSRVVLTRSHTHTHTYIQSLPFSATACLFGDWASWSWLPGIVVFFTKVTGVPKEGERQDRAERRPKKGKKRKAQTHTAEKWLRSFTLEEWSQPRTRARSGVGTGREREPPTGKHGHMISWFTKEQYVRVLNSYVTVAELHVPSESWLVWIPCLPPAPRSWVYTPANYYYNASFILGGIV